MHVGASDGGAHVGSFATYGDTGFLLSRYVRETGALTLEGAVKKITADPATIWGIPDRGQLKPGYAADVVVFDADTIGRGPEIASDDFPGGGTRWIRRSRGRRHRRRQRRGDLDRRRRLHRGRPRRRHRRPRLTP